MSEQASKYKQMAATINVSQVQQEIQNYLDGDEDLARLLGKKGLAPSSVNQQIADALKLLDMKD